MKWKVYQNVLSIVKNRNQFQEKNEFKKREVEEYKNELKQSRKKIKWFYNRIRKMTKRIKRK